MKNVPKLVINDLTDGRLALFLNGQIFSNRGPESLKMHFILVNLVLSD